MKAKATLQKSRLTTEYLQVIMGNIDPNIHYTKLLPRKLPNIQRWQTGIRGEKKTWIVLFAEKYILKNILGFVWVYVCVCFSGDSGRKRWRLAAIGWLPKTAGIGSSMPTILKRISGSHNGWIFQIIYILKIYNFDRYINAKQHVFWFIFLVKGDLF